MPFNPLSLINDPEYKKLPPELQREVRERYFQEVLSKDPYYLGMKEDQQVAFKKRFGLEPPEQPARGFKESFMARTGFGPEGGLTGVPAIDIPLGVLAIPGALTGAATESLTGSSALGTGIGLGTDLLVGAKGFGALKALRGGKGAIPASTEEIIDVAANMKAAGQLGRTPMESFPGVAGVMQEAMKRGQPLAKQDVYEGFLGRLNKELGTVQTKDLLTRMQGEGVSEGFQNRLTQELGKAQTSDLLTRMRGAAVHQGFLKRLEDAKTQLVDETGVKLIGTADDVATKLWGTETTGRLADIKRQLWGQRGATGAGVLGVGVGAAIGGAIGGAFGEDPQERMKDALLGAGVGAATVGVLLSMGRAKPILAGLGGILAKEGTGYQVFTKTGKLAGTLETDASPAQIAEAAKLSSKARSALPQPLQEAVNYLDGDGVNLTLFHLKTNLEKATPRVFGVPPFDLGRNVPVLKRVADVLDEGADKTKAFEGWFVEQINAILHPIHRHPGSIERVGAFLDGQSVALSTQESAVANQARGLLNKAADLLQIPQEKRITNYFTRIRDVVTATTSQQVTMGGRDIPIKGMVELVKGEVYIPVRVENALPKHWVPYFLKERTADEPATKLGREAWVAYARGFGRSLAMNGGINPYTNQPTIGALSKLQPILKELPDDRAVLDYTVDWINRSIGVPQGVTGGAFGKKTPEVVSIIKNMQFMRTLGFNLLSPALNLTQSLNTFARSSVGSWLGGLSDVLDPAMRLLAKQNGIVGDIAKADIDAIVGTPLTQLSASVLDKVGFLFKGSETLVRQHAFFTGLRDAKKLGLTGDDILTYARRLTSETQYRFGKEGLPFTFRQQGSGIGELIQQFKTYPVNQAFFMKNLFLDDIANLGREFPFKRTTKFFGAMMGLMGSEATTLGLDKSISKFFTDNEEQLRIKGFFPAMGVHLAGQLGLGVLPVENLKSLFFFLPGPALAMVTDAMSWASWIAKMDPAAPYGKNYMIGPGFGDPLSAEQLASRLTRLIPIGGVMTNRIRRSLLELQTPGEVREAATVEQAFGFEPMTGMEKLIQTGTGKANPLLTLGGFQSPERATRLELGGEQVDLIQARNQVVREAAKLVLVGKQADALKLLDKFEKKYGASARISPQAIRAAMLASQLPVEERRARRAPIELRGKFLEKLLEE